jgi:hypothetical protein
LRQKDFINFCLYFISLSFLSFLFLYFINLLEQTRSISLSLSSHFTLTMKRSAKWKRSREAIFSGDASVSHHRCMYLYIFKKNWYITKSKRKMKKEAKSRTRVRCLQKKKKRGWDTLKTSNKRIFTICACGIVERSTSQH